MRKLWLANDRVNKETGATELHLFEGIEPPDFDDHGSVSNDDCDYLGDVPSASVRGQLPKPGTYAEVVLLVKAGDA